MSKLLFTKKFQKNYSFVQKWFSEVLDIYPEKGRLRKKIRKKSENRL